jgi:hypothetical protein
VNPTFRRALRKLGLASPFSDVICAEYYKSICFDSAWKARVSVQQKLVFLRVPERGDLTDVCPLDDETTHEKFVFQSPDSVEVDRNKRGRDVVAIDWEPRARITRYALYEHQQTWNYSGSSSQIASFVEYQCDCKTGVFHFEMVTPQTFDTAVFFVRPRWTALNTENRRLKYALKQVEANAPQAALRDNGTRVEWKITEPKIGTRYMLAVFHHNGIVLAKDKLAKSTFFGGMRELMARRAR